MNTNNTSRNIITDFIQYKAKNKRIPMGKAFINEVHLTMRNLVKEFESGIFTNMNGIQTIPTTQLTNEQKVQPTDNTVHQDSQIIIDNQESASAADTPDQKSMNTFAKKLGGFIKSQIYKHSTRSKHSSLGKMPQLLASASTMFVQKKSPFVFMQQGVFHITWMYLLISIFLYNMFTIPFRQAFFDSDITFNSYWLFADVLADLVYLLDIVVETQTSYLDKGLMVVNSKQIRNHYLRSHMFILDLFAIFPLDYIMMSLKSEPIFRFLRFIKWEKCRKYKDIIASRTINPNFARLFILLVSFMWCINTMSAVYFFFSKLEGFMGGWAYPEPVEEYAKFSRKYLKCLYWAFGTLTGIAEVEEPNTTLGFCIQLFGNILGVVFFAAILNEAGSIIQHRDAAKLHYDKALDEAKTYMDQNGTSSNLRKYILEYYNHAWTCGLATGGIDIESLIYLSTKWKKTLAYESHRETLKKVDFFKECEPDFLSELLLKMRFILTLPQEFIVKNKEVAKEMFIIAEGLVEVRSERGQILRTLKKGEFFGEIGLLSGTNRRTADVISVGFSKLFILSREDLLGVLKFYPLAQNVLERKAQSLLTSDKKKKDEEFKKEAAAHHVSATEINLEDEEPDPSWQPRYSHVPIDSHLVTAESVDFPEIGPIEIDEEYIQKILLDKKEIISEKRVRKAALKLYEVLKSPKIIKIMDNALRRLIYGSKVEGKEMSLKSMFLFFQCMTEILTGYQNRRLNLEQRINVQRAKVVALETKLGLSPSTDPS